MVMQGAAAAKEEQAAAKEDQAAAEEELAAAKEEQAAAKEEQAAAEEKLVAAEEELVADAASSPPPVARTKSSASVPVSVNQDAMDSTPQDPDETGPKPPANDDQPSEVV